MRANGHARDPITSRAGRRLTTRPTKAELLPTARYEEPCRSNALLLPEPGATTGPSTSKRSPLRCRFCLPLSHQCCRQKEGAGDEGLVASPALCCFCRPGHLAGNTESWGDGATPSPKERTEPCCVQACISLLLGTLRLSQRPPDIILHGVFSFDILFQNKTNGWTSLYVSGICL